MVIKRNGDLINFDKEKIKTAITKAMKYGSGKYNQKLVDKITNEIEIFYNKEISKNKDYRLSIYEIETMIFSKLIENQDEDTARAYTEYKAIRAYQRSNNTTDQNIMSLVDRKNEVLLKENSNKDAVINSTQRDLLAGEISKDIAMRKIIPTHLVQAHKNATIHIHDMDYILQPMTNCCLINIGDMLENGTVINKKQIKKPRSFQVACTVLTQIIAQIASNQYGLTKISYPTAV